MTIPLPAGADPGALNRESYDAIAAEWDAARTVMRTVMRAGERPFVETMLDGLPPGSAILDLGCGTGRPLGEFVLARGYRVTGVDQSRALLAAARARFPAARWVQARLEDFAADDAYDGAICWDALFHVERAYHEAILARVHGCLRPGARIMLSVGGSPHPPFTDTMFGRTFYYDSHSPGEVLALLHRIGFEPLLHEFLELPTTGRDKGRYGIVARRA